MPNRIKMRHLEAVIALAEEMHYGRAAKRVGLTQSGLSRCIQSAEREANASLFERNRSGIELTDAGRSYVEHARISVAYGERAMRSAIERREGADTVLQIGKAPDVDPALVDILYSIRLPFFPTLDITVQSESSSDLAHDLLSTDLDLALITDPTQNAKLTMTKLSETPLHVVIPRDHILSSKVSLKMADLRDERWIVFQKRTHPVLYERIMKRTKMRAFTRGASTISSTQKKDISNYRPDHVLVFHRASRGIEKHEALTVTNVSGSSIHTMNERGEEKSVSLTQARSFSVHERKEIEVAAGDKLLMMGNRKEPGFRATNGELTTVRSVERGIINLEDGRSVPANYREFTHGYAVTAHRSQGKTVDHVIVSADAMKQELFYVAASRGREGLSIVTSDVDRLGESLGVSMARPSAIELANDIAQQKVAHNQDIAQGLKQETKLPMKTPEIGFEMGLGF